MNNRASFIEIVTATFAVGESRLFALTGQYFEIIDATFPVDVTLSDFYGAQRGLMKSAEASFNLKGTEFGVIQITSASAQTIRFAYGTGEAGTRRAAGAVSIVGTVPVTGPLTDAQLRASVVDIRARPEAATAFHNVTGALGAGAVETLVTPAANTNGLIVLYAAFNDLKATESEMSLLHKTSAPATMYDGFPVLISILSSQGSSVYTTGGQLNHPALVPAGHGLYFVAGSGTSGNSRRTARWRLL